MRLRPGPLTSRLRRSRRRPPLVIWLSQLPGTVEDCAAGMFTVDERELFLESLAEDHIVNPPSGGPWSVAGGMAQAQLILLPLTPAQALAPAHHVRFAELIRRAVRTTIGMGAHELVLGSLTTWGSGHGAVAVAEVERCNTEHHHDPSPLLISTGNSGTLGVLDSQICELAPDRDTVIGIIGLGNLGKGLLDRLLSRGQRRVVVLVRSQAGVDQALNRVLVRRADAGLPLPRTEVVAATVASGLVRECHLVVTTTASPATVLCPRDLDAPTVVVDPSIPPAVTDDPGWRAGGHVVYTEAAQLDLGGDLAVPSWRWAGRPGTLYSCLAYGAARALARHSDHVGWDHDVGEPSVRQAAWFEVERAARSWGHAQPVMFGEPISLDAGREVLAVRLTHGVGSR